MEISFITSSESKKELIMNMLIWITEP